MLPANQQKWVDLFNTTRKRFQTEITDIPIANKAYRLRALDRMMTKAESMRNMALASSLIEQAAKEVGDAYTNRQKVEHTSPDGSMSQRPSRLTFKAKVSNTGASTFAANGGSAYPLYSHANQALQGGEIVANGLIEVEWNSTLTAWVLCGNSGGATPVLAGTQTNHAVNLGQSNLALAGKADLNGNASQGFSVAAGTAPNSAVACNQFTSGNNGNGAWTKLPGGGQWCRQNLNLAANATTTWTFPAAPAVFITAINGASQCWINAIGANSWCIYNNNTAINVNILAVW